MTISLNAIFIVDSNLFNIVEGLAFTAPLFAALAAAAISFSFNKVVINRGDGVACRFNDIDACNGTVITCNENSFESHDCPCILECARPIVLKGTAKFELCLNTFVGFGGSPQVSVGGCDLTDQAKLLLMSNSMSRGDAQACDLPFFYFGAMMQLQVSAELSVSMNDCFDIAGGVKALLCALALGNIMRPCTTCPLNFCLNKYYDELLLTDSAIKSAVPSELAGAISPAHTCAESGYSTLAPRDSGADARGAVVAIAAVAAAAALLL